VIPPTAVRPSRPQLVTAFTGTMEPASVPAYNAFACVMAGVDSLTPSPPLAPVDGGASSTITLAPVPNTGTFSNLAAPYTKDFTVAAGLDTGHLTGTTVRVTGSLQGFGGQALLGVGVATAGTPAFSINASYSVGLFALLGHYSPLMWVVTEARDNVGDVSRHRVLLTPATGAITDVLPPPSIPIVNQPAGPSTGPPRVTFSDRLDRAALPFGLAIGEVVATDGPGRKWRVIYEDGDGQGGVRAVQFPDLGTSVTGLATGTWHVQAEGRLFLSTTMTPGNLLLEERRRQEVTFARSTVMDFLIQ
jgi:hypothetical protein